METRGANRIWKVPNAHAVCCYLVQVQRETEQHLRPIYFQAQHVNKKTKGGGGARSYVSRVLKGVGLPFPFLKGKEKVKKMKIIF